MSDITDKFEELGRFLDGDEKEPLTSAREVREKAREAFRSHFGKVITDLRAKRRLSLSEASERIGVKPQAVSQWEKGKNLPSLEIIPSVAKAYRLSTSAFMSIVFPE